MRDMTPDELEDWLTQSHALYVSKVHHGEVSVTVDCGGMTPGCECWVECDQGACLVDPDDIMQITELGTMRHGVPHRLHIEAAYWLVASGHCMTRLLKISEECEELILRSSVSAGQTVPVLVDMVYEKYQFRLDVRPESGSWLSL